MESELLNNVKQFVIQTFNDKVFEKRAFHNIHHTLDVVKAAEEIGKHMALTADALDSVLIAAWFHDIGYIHGAENHEAEGAHKAQELLKSWGASSQKITDVTEAILATHVPQQPTTIISRVLCDADLHHLATDTCETKSLQLREEWKTWDGKEFNDAEWWQANLVFLENHSYHTTYGQTVLKAGKEKNILLLRNKLNVAHNE